MYVSLCMYAKIKSRLKEEAAANVFKDVRAKIF